MIILNITDDHLIKCDACNIGRTGENEAEIIQVILPEDLQNKWLYLEFEKPDKTKFVTPRIDVVDGVGNYSIGGNLVDQSGMLKVEVVVRDENGICWKSNIKQYSIIEAINASTEVEKNNPDFITEAQKILDEIKNTGGTGGTGGKVDDVRVDGVTVVTDKIANIQLRQLVLDILIEHGLIQLESLTEEQIEALNNMVCEIDKNGELSITYDDTILDLDFSIEDKNLIVNSNINATFGINYNGEMEVSYE